MDYSSYVFVEEFDSDEQIKIGPPNKQSAMSLSNSVGGQLVIWDWQ